MVNEEAKTIALAAVLAFGLSPAWAQDPGTQEKAAGEMQTMPGMAQGQMDHGAMTGVGQGDMSNMTPGGSMNSGSMDMQGGPAPIDARDPHAYSGGYTLESGPYARPGPRELRMADEHNFGALLIDRLERVYTDNGDATAYDAQAWFGRDYDRLVLKAEGDVARGRLQEARTEALWGHAVATFWDTRLGARYDYGVGSDRGWLAFGIQGLAPYWFNVDATAYAGSRGRTALRLGAEYEMLLTQKLILQPRIEMNLYGKRDEAREIGRGLSDASAGLRLRYEFTRQIAPYVGVEWARKFGGTADFARVAGEATQNTRLVAGLRFWF
jgi:copper resistance protein B